MPTPNTQKKRSSIVVFVDRNGLVDAYLREELPDVGRVTYRALPHVKVDAPSQQSTLLSWVQTFLSIFAGFVS